MSLEHLKRIESMQQEAREALSGNSSFIKALQSEIRTLKIEILRLKHKANVIQDFKDWKFRIDDIRDMLLSHSGFDEWSVPVINLKTLSDIFNKRIEKQKEI